MRYCANKQINYRHAHMCTKTSQKLYWVSDNKHVFWRNSLFLGINLLLPNPKQKAADSLSLKKLTWRSLVIQWEVKTQSPYFSSKAEPRFHMDKMRGYAFGCRLHQQVELNSLNHTTVAFFNCPIRWSNCSHHDITQLHLTFNKSTQKTFIYNNIVIYCMVYLQ